MHNIIFASPSKSRIRNLQSIGRGLRLKDDNSAATLYDIADDISYNGKENYTLQHFKERINIYNGEDFNYEIHNVELINGRKTQPNPIKIIKLINGDDIVCSLPAEQLGDKSPLLRLNRPLQVKYIPQFTAQGLKDYVALIKWSPYTRDAILTIPKDKILTIVNANPDMSKSYAHVVIGYDKSEPWLEKRSRQYLKEKD